MVRECRGIGNGGIKSEDGGDSSTRRGAVHGWRLARRQTHQPGEGRAVTDTREHQRGDPVSAVYEALVVGMLLMDGREVSVRAGSQGWESGLGVGGHP